MLAFKKLRLSGFKSFVDRTEMDIGDGLTGIVGPNGCGKSNLVEALRWVMGESSAKKMRGGGMEDVIFAGTSTRSKRNFAEVSILLDNQDRQAHAQFNNESEIEITRKIERDKGSAYKINGKNARARDVQLLFADTMTGAHSPALVSQGRITEIINAKPQNRRLILEESAGISGLYARRHEAELRLKAASQNLERLEDLVSSMESRLAALKKQSRQAAKYKNLSAQIRQFEASIAYFQWLNLKQKMVSAEKELGEHETQVADCLTTVTQLTKTQNTQAESLPGLRTLEAEAAAALQAASLSLQRLDDQEQNHQRNLEECERQIKQILDDEKHEHQMMSENKILLEKLEKEQAEIIDQQKGEKSGIDAQIERKKSLEEKVLKLESEYEVFMQSAADEKAYQQSLERDIASDESRLLVCEERLEKIQSELQKEKENFENNDQLQKLKDQVITLEESISNLQKDLVKAEDERNTLQDRIIVLSAEVKNLEDRKSEAAFEMKALEALIENRDEIQDQSLIHHLKTGKGFELAVSRALGDGLNASLEKDQGRYWLYRDLKTLPDLPKGAEPLSNFVEGPKEIRAALHMIGIVETEEDGEALSAELLPGQSLVSKSGNYWRWDGYCVHAEATDNNAVFIEQKNRHKYLKETHADLEARLEKPAEDLKSQKNAENALSEKIETFRNQLRGLEKKLAEARQNLNQLTEERSARFADIAKLEEAQKITLEDRGISKKSLQENKEKLNLFLNEKDDQKENKLSSIRALLSEARDSLQDVIRKHDQLYQEQNRRKARLHAIADERVNLQNRSIRSREKIKDYAVRRETTESKLKALKAQPKDFEAKRRDLMDKTAELERIRHDHAEKLNAAENEYQETAKALREAESRLSTARERRAHIQASLKGLLDQMNTLIDQIQEKFDMKPENLKSHIHLNFDLEKADLENLKSQKERLVFERESIGPVNLRADVEAQELEKELTAILYDRNDLTQAIEELRGGIAKLNKEARERLLATFDHVNAHFQNLFKRLYNGGQAKLSLIESEDPLGSGLEIYAQPPGKTLQSLSLLSGGEQTLASIALIFAMFLTNPSPICVLDEIDAPLDDANVERVCDLLEEMAEKGETRFLVITHHRLTMARVDRLYGVTMAERGVSQIVSVDLNQQLSLLDEAA